MALPTHVTIILSDLLHLDSRHCLPMTVWLESNWGAKKHGKPLASKQISPSQKKFKVGA